LRRTQGQPGAPRACGRAATRRGTRQHTLRRAVARRGAYTWWSRPPPARPTSVAPATAVFCCSCFPPPPLPPTVAVICTTPLCSRACRTSCLGSPSPPRCAAPLHRSLPFILDW